MNNMPPAQRVSTPNAKTPTVNGVATSSIVYSISGALTVSASPNARPRATFNVVGLSATLKTAGSSASVIALLRNGTVIQSVTIPAGQTYAFTTFAAELFQARTDNYAVSITTAGSGASDLAGEIEIQ